ncbi:MAG: zinc ribbon domain-containing protein [Nitrososphaerales archaeon]
MLAGRLMMDSAYETHKGLENLKNAFLLYLIGSIVALVPIIGGIGGIVDFVGLIFLILGWRALGRSSLAEAPNYKSTGRWFVLAIIIAIVIGIVGTIVSAVLLFGAIANQIGNSPGTTPNFTQSSLQPFMIGIAVTVIIAEAVWISAWVKMNSSMKKLAAEVSQPRIATAGLLFLVQIIVALVAEIGLFYSIFYGISSLSRLSASGSAGNLFGSYYGMLTGSFALFGILGILSSVIAMVAAYFGYRGVKDALASNVITPPAPPPPPNLPPQDQLYCTKCGHKIENANSTFCPSCGRNLSA